jgi:hypothetical protein
MGNIALFVSIHPLSAAYRCVKASAHIRLLNCLLCNLATYPNMPPAMYLGSRSEAGPLDATPQGGYNVAVVVTLASTSAALVVLVLTIGWVHIKTRKQLRHALIVLEGAKARATFWEQDLQDLQD